MFGNFIGWLFTIGLLNGLIAALCLFIPLSSHEEKVKKAKYAEIEPKHRWRLDAKEEYEQWEKEYDAKRAKYWNAALVLILVIVVATAGVLTYADYMFEQAPWTEENYVTHQIINIADNSEINGAIYGSRRYVRGYIGEDTIYHYYYKNARGGWDLQKVNEENACLFLTDGEPVAKWYRIHKEFWWNEATKYRCDIYIPEGTITTEFVIDME